MSDDGRLNFGVYNDGTKVLTTATAYNDNRWHHVVASVSPDGMKLFIDGKLDGHLPERDQGAGLQRLLEDRQRQPDRLGERTEDDSILAGNVDEFAVYPYGLTAGQIKTHYSVGNGSTAPRRRLYGNGDRARRGPSTRAPQYPLALRRSRSTDGTSVTVRPRPARLRRTLMRRPEPMRSS
ncbi:LamG domain-containing protein [Microbacterium oxydans]|nr:LamG domain-containing protein [Microbacterium oxydans]